MNQKMLNTSHEIAQALGLRVDSQTGELYGAHNGYEIILRYTTNNLFSLIVSVCQGGTLPDAKLLRSAVKTSKAVNGCVVQRYKATYTFRSAMSRQKSIENVREGVQAVTGFLRENGFNNCCQNCGSMCETGAYYVGGVPSLLCPGCFASSSVSAETKKNNDEQKHENVVGGVVGAFIGSLIGAAVIVLLGQLGYVSALSGIVMSICAIKGYELLGGRLSKKGVVISLLLIVAMVYIGNRTDWAISVAAYYDVNVFDAFRAIPTLISEGYIEQKTYIANLVMVYVFALLGAVPTLVGVVKGQKQAYVTCRMSDGAVASDSWN